MAPNVPDGRDGTALAGLRLALERAGYTAERVEERLGTHELSSRPIDTAVHLHRLDGSDSFSTLARLFLLGDDVEVERIEEAVAPLWTEQLAALGLVAAVGETMRALVRLVPHGDYYVASDAGPESGEDVPFDHVPGIQAPSVTLAKLAVRRPCARALDLGTGCGIQALLAAKHAERVVATDVNPRALGLAAFNAALNGIHTIEFRLGDGFEPVQGERFDLIVANPPYVISPDASYAYRDSGLPADELCHRVVEGAATHLTEGGFAHLLVSWVHAAGWLRPLGESDPDRYDEALDRWLEYLARLRIEAIGYGAVVLRRREGGRNWIRTDPLPLDRLEPAGEHTLRVFAAQDVLGRLDDERLLDLPLALTENHRLQQTLVARGGLVVESQTLQLTEGLSFAVGVDRHTVSLLPHCDGRRTLRDVLELARRTFELEPEEQERFVPAAIPVVRRLVELGFLEPL